MPKPFFMVFVEGASTPSQKHDSPEAAHEEAERLVLKHGKAAYILRAVKKISIKQEFDTVDLTEA